MTADELKRKAAERAVEFVEDGMSLGLGTGSTARHVLEVIAERRARGELKNIRGVPTSKATHELATKLGIPLMSLDDLPYLDLAIDGADEVDPDLNLIKGLGGALLWEKIVESAADRLIIVVDESKLVDRLGDKAPVPIEVVPFGAETHIKFLDDLGGKATFRMAGREKFITDSKHYIIDCAFEDGIADPWVLETELQQRAGIVESGLFLDMAEAVVVASASGIRVMDRGEQ